MNADLCCETSFADLHVRIRTWHNACLRMYGTLCFLALISNSVVFIYPGKFLPVFCRSQQFWIIIVTGLWVWSKHGKDDRLLLHASCFTSPQRSTCTHVVQYTHEVHTMHTLTVRSIKWPPKWTERMHVHQRGHRYWYTHSVVLGKASSWSRTWQPRRRKPIPKRDLF